MAATLQHQAESELFLKRAPVAVPNSQPWLPEKSSQAGLDSTPSFSPVSPSSASFCKGGATGSVKGSSVTFEAPQQIGSTPCLNSDQVHGMFADPVKGSEATLDVAPCTPMQSFPRQKHQFIDTPEPSHTFPYLSLGIGSSLENPPSAKGISHASYTASFQQSYSHPQTVTSNPSGSLGLIESEVQTEGSALHKENLLSLALSKHETRLQVTEQSSPVLSFAHYSGHPQSHRIFASPGLPKLPCANLSLSQLAPSSQLPPSKELFSVGSTMSHKNGKLQSTPSQATPKPSVLPAFTGYSDLLADGESAGAAVKQSSRAAKSLSLGSFDVDKRVSFSPCAFSQGAVSTDLPLDPVKAHRSYPEVLPTTTSSACAVDKPADRTMSHGTQGDANSREAVKYMELLTGSQGQLPNEHFATGKFANADAHSNGMSHSLVLTLNETTPDTGIGVRRASFLPVNGPPGGGEAGISSNKKRPTGEYKDISCDKVEPTNRSNLFKQDFMQMSSRDKVESPKRARTSEPYGSNCIWKSPIANQMQPCSFGIKEEPLNDPEAASSTVAISLTSSCAESVLKFPEKGLAVIGGLKCMTNSAFAQIPKALSTFSTGEPSLPPLALGAPQKLCDTEPGSIPVHTSGTGDADWGKFLALSAAPAGNTVTAVKDKLLPFQQRFKQLQAFLKQCDEADQTDRLQALMALPPTARSGHAVELESRAKRLALEEGKEMTRMKVLNVLGRLSDRNTSDAGATPNGPRLPAPGVPTKLKQLS